MKTCNKCQQSLALSEFPTRTNNNGSTSLRAECKVCWKARKQGDYIKNKGAALQVAAERRASDVYRQYLEATREQRKAYKAKYRRQAGVPTIEEQKAQTRARAEARARAKEQQRPHDAHVREWRSDSARYAKWCYQHDPRYAMYQRLKRWMHKHLGDKLPSRKWSQHLGYTPEELRQHLERQFAKGMGWHNKGDWHIDHIRPVSSFDITGVDSPEFRECFGLANLRPVWATENLRKGARREFLL